MFSFLHVLLYLEDSECGDLDGGVGDTPPRGDTDAHRVTVYAGRLDWRSGSARFRVASDTCGSVCPPTTPPTPPAATDESVARLALRVGLCMERARTGAWGRGRPARARAASVYDMDEANGWPLMSPRLDMDPSGESRSSVLTSGHGKRLEYCLLTALPPPPLPSSDCCFFLSKPKALRTNPPTLLHRKQKCHTSQRNRHEAYQDH